MSDVLLVVDDRNAKIVGVGSPFNVRLRGDRLIMTNDSFLDIKKDSAGMTISAEGGGSTPGSD